MKNEIAVDCFSYLVTEWWRNEKKFRFTACGAAISLSGFYNYWTLEETEFIFQVRQWHLSLMLNLTSSIRTLCFRADRSARFYFQDSIIESASRVSRERCSCFHRIVHPQLLFLHCNKFSSISCIEWMLASFDHQEITRISDDEKEKNFSRRDLEGRRWRTDQRSEQPVTSARTCEAVPANVRRPTSSFFFSRRIERRHGQIDIATQRGAASFAFSYCGRPTPRSLSGSLTPPTTAVW